MSQRFPARSPRKQNRRFRRKAGGKVPAFILSTAAALMLPQMVKAQIFWDPNGNSSDGIVGGPGIWDTTSLFWDTNFDGINQAWVNNTPIGDVARFEGTGGQVRLGVPIVARILDFAVPGYELTNNGNAANTLTLAGPSAGFLLQSGRLDVSAQILGTDGLRLDDTTPNLDGLSGTLALTNANNLYSGVTTIAAGVIEVQSLPNVGSPSSIGVGGDALVFDEIFGLVRNTNSYITLDGGTLSYTGNGTGTDRVFTITNRGGGIDSSGTGASLGFSQTATGVRSSGAGPRTLTLSGTNIAFNNIASPMADGGIGSPLSVVKSGSGTWVANSQNLYTGSTTINGGTLIVSALGSSGSASGIGSGDNIPQSLVLNGGTLRYTGTASATDRSFTLGPNGGRIEASGSGALQMISTGTVASTGTGDRTLTLGGVALDNIMRVQLTDPMTAWALTGANTIARFNVGSPEVIDQTVTITNLQSGENLHSLDFDPATGDLYAMGTSGSGAVNRLYKINLPATPQATTTTAASFAAITGLNVGAAVNYGFDFNPVTGLIRLTTNTDESHEFSKTGVLTTPASPNVNPTAATLIGLGYSNNFPGAVSTTLYGIDSAGDNLVTFNSSTGEITPVGSFDTSARDWTVNDVSDLDIGSNGAAYALLQDGSTFRLANIDLLTGNASLVGLGFNPAIGAAAVRDLSLVVSGKTSLLKTGAGSWSIDRSGKHIGNTYTGTTTIAQGRLTLNFNFADTTDTHIISPQSPLVIGGGTLAITGKNPTGTSPNIVSYNNVQTFNGLTLLPGGSTIAPAAGTGASTLVLNLGALAARPAFATLSFVPGNLTTVTMTAANDSTGILGAWATFGNGDWAAMTGSNVGAYTGYTDVTLGGTIADASSHVRLTAGTGNVTLGGSPRTTINTLVQSTSTAATISNPNQTLRLGTVGGILAANQALTIGTAPNSGTLTAGGTDNTAGELIFQNNATTLLTVNSVIANNGSGVVSLVNAGSGITVLNGVNTYTGPTVLNNGMLFIGDNRALSTSTVVVNSSTTPVIFASSSTAGREIKNDFILNSDLQFVDNRAGAAATGVGGLVIRGTVNLTGGERVITVNQNNGYVTLDGTLTNGALVKSGPGALAFNDLALTNVSSITLAQGSLDLWSPAGLGGTPINVISGSTGALSASGAFYSPVASNIFLGGNLTLGRAQISDGIDLGGFIDLSNSTFTNPRVVSAAGAFPQQQQRLSGTVVNGTLGKGGSSELVFSSATSTYAGGTVIFSSATGSSLRVTASARLGANQVGNDIYVGQDPLAISPPNGPALIANSYSVLRLDSIANVQSNQALVLSNFATNTMPLLGWGTAFETNPNAVGFVDYQNGSIYNLGLQNVRVYATDDFIHGTPGPVGIAIDGINASVDVIGKVLQGVPNAGVWMGATFANGTYTGGPIAVGSTMTYRLGGGGGTLTIANDNVLTGQNNLVVGSYDQTARGIIGTVFLPGGQNFGGVLTVGAGTTLVAGRNAALGTGFTPIYLATGTASSLSLRSTGAHSSIDNQYADRDFAILATSTLNIDPLGGGQNGRVEIGSLDFSPVATSFTPEGVLPANPTLVTNASNGFEFAVKRPVTLISNLPQTPSTSATNTFQVNSGFLSIEAPIIQTDPLDTAGANLQKTGGGTLILSQPTSHTGLTIANGGTLVLTNPDIIPGIMRLQSGVLSLRSNSTAPSVYDFTEFQLFGATVSTIFAGPISPTGIAKYSGTRMDIPNLASVANGNAFPTGLTINGTLNSSVRVLGLTTIGANFTMTVNAARTELMGNVQNATAGAFNFTKAGIGTLILSGRNTLTGNTVISQGTIVANHATSNLIDTFGSGTLSFTGTSSGAILLGGTGITLSKAIALDSTAGTQVLGSYDAGIKTFSGNITMASGSNGVTLAAESGSTVNFTGVIAGGTGSAVSFGSLGSGVLLPIPGTPALGRGTVNLNPTAGTGNTFTGPLVVNNGTLIGQAQATSGSPFGANNAITLNQGTLQLTGRTATTNTATTGVLNVAGGAQLAISDANDAFTTRFTAGGLTRTGNGTLNFLPTNQAALTFTTPPAVTNGILAPWVVKTTAGVGDYVTMSGNDVVTASYTVTDINASTGTNAVVNEDGATLSNDRGAYALRLSGALDLGGKVLSIGNQFTADLGGLMLNGTTSVTNGTINLGVSEGLVYVSGNSTISAAIVGLGTTSLTKFGDGALTLSSTGNTYRGATSVARGTLRMGAENALGRWTNGGVQLATGLTVNANGLLDLNGFDTEVGSLAGNYGAAVAVSTSRLTVGRNNANTVFSGSLLGNASAVLQKVGTGSLTLDNTRADSSASTFAGSVLVDQGTLILVIADQTNGSPFPVGNSLASVRTITLRGGTLSLRTSGDNVAASNQNMMGRYNIVAGAANSILDVGRFGATETQKTIELGSLVLGRNEFQTTLSTASGAIVPAFMDTVTLTDHARINTNSAELSISGRVTDNGQGYTLNKVGGSNLFLSNPFNDYSGGTIIAGGNLFFGSRGEDVMRFAGNSLGLNDRGRAGTGPIVLETNTVINFSDVENVAPGQTVRVLSGTTTHGSSSGFVIQTDRKVSDFNLRTLGRGSLQIGMQNGGTYTTPLDMSKLGDGEWGLTSGRGVETLYTPTTLGAGAGNVFRFYGSNTNNASFVIMGQNVVTGLGSVEVGRALTDLGGNPGQANAAIRFMLGQDYTGKTLVHRAANAGGSSAAILDFRGTLASGTSASNAIEVYGRLTATGAGTFTNSETALNNVNTHVLLRPGSELALDYNANASNSTTFLVPLGTTSATGFLNKWGDAQPIVLDGATLRVQSAAGALTTEVIGAVTYKGAAEIFPQTAGTGGNTAIVLNGALTRVNLGTLAFRTTLGQFGASGEPGTTAGQRVVFKAFNNDPLFYANASGIARGVVSGGTANGTVIRMVQPRFFSNTANTFVDYDPNTVLGFSDVPLTTVNNATLNFGSPNDGTAILDHVTTAVTVANNTDIWALRTGVSIGANTDYNDVITIRSGGLAITAGLDIFPKLSFKNGATVQEADIWTVLAGSSVTLRGKITANNLVKTGPGTLVLSADNTVAGGEGLTGTLQVNGGTLVLGGVNTNPGGAADTVITAAQALGSVTNLRLHAGNFNNAGNQMPQVNLLSTAAATYPQSITVSQFVPFATINVDRVGTSGTNASLTVAGGLTIEGGGSDGTVLAFTNGNDFDFTSSGPTTLGVAMGGDTATAPIGISVTNNNGTNNVMLLGKVSGPARLVKSGNGPLILANSGVAAAGNDFSGGITINDGTLQLRNGELGSGVATGFQAAGTGSILLNRGTLQLFGITTNANFASLDTNNLTIAGHGVLAFDRPGTTGSPTLILGGTNATLTTQNSTNIQVNSGAAAPGVWAGKTVINDSPTFNTAQTSFTLGNASAGDSITGTGHIYKTGNNVLVFNSGANTNTLSGGIDIFQGQVRIATSTAETFGTGLIRISPSGILGVTAVANVTSNTQVTAFHSNSTSFAGLALRASGLNPTSFLDNSKITTGLVGGASGTGNGGLLAIDATYSAALPSQAALFDGAWFYGSTVGGTYSGAAFAAGANSTYRLGGGGSTLNLTTTANMLNGANSVLIGKPNALSGNGTVSIQITNNYSGGTQIGRVRDIGGNFTVSQADVVRGFSDSPLGSGAVEVFGNLQFLSSGTGVLQGSAVSNAGAGDTNRNTFNFHPGARLIFQNSTVYADTVGNPQGRWADTAGINLRSSDVEMLGNTTATNGNNLYNSETVGAVTFAGGSEIRMVRGGTTLDAQLVMPSLTRVGNGTVTIVHAAGGSLGLNSYSAGAPAGTGILGTGSDIITIGDRSNLVDPNGMVKPFIVDRTDNNFVFYDPASDSLRTITAALATTNFIPYTTNAAATVSLNDPNAILDNNAAATINGLIDIWGLRIQQDLSAGSNGAFGTITLRSGGLTIAGGTARTVNANVNFGLGGTGEALIHTSSANLTINGQINASAVTKFGTSSLTINQDQPGIGPAVPWNINQGQLIVQTPGGLGFGAVNLNGWTGNTGQTVTELRFVFNSGSPDELRLTSGKITSLDFNLIRMQTNTNDRTVRISDLDLTTTNAVKGTGVPGVLWLRMDGARSTMNTGAMTMFDDYVLQVDATSFGPGSTSGVRPDSINNAGLYNLTKIGDGVLILGNNSATFTGTGKTFTVNEGAVKVQHNGSLGAAGTVAIIDNGGALEIATQNFTPVGTLLQRSGSIERWSVNGARNGGVTLPAGVHLQIAANQTGFQTITLNGGSIMGYLPVDVDEVAVFQSLGANVTVNVVSDSMLGQPYPAGTNVVGGGVNHIYYDMGKQNQMNNPLNPVLQGAVLDIRGTISGQSGSETLTKVGMDVIQLSGNNNAGFGFNTTIREGMIVLGSSNALPAAKALTMSSSGALDLNGFNATTGSLAGNSANTMIGNSATTTNTLTVNGGSSYAGGLSGNIEFKYDGGGSFTLSGNHIHSGATTVESGSLILTGSATGTTTFKAGSGGTLNVTNANGTPNSFQLLPGQTLAGGDEAAAGFVTGTVTAKSGSVVSPGMEPGLTGILQISTGNLSLESGSTFKLELEGNVAGTGYDQLIVNSGNLSLGGAKLELAVELGSVAVGEVYYILLHNGANPTTGTFAGLGQSSLFTVNGYEFQISYTANSDLGAGGFSSGTGNDVALLVTIPEPGSLAGLCAGLGTLLGLRRFRRRTLS